MVLPVISARKLATPSPFDALAQLLILIDTLKSEGIVLTDIDLGGGFGVTYDDEPAFDVTAWGSTVKQRLVDRA